MKKGLQKKLFMLALAMILLIPGKSADNSGRQITEPGEKLAFVTFVSNDEQVRVVRALIQSVQENGGAYHSAMIYVVTTDPTELPCDSLQMDGVQVLPLDMDPSFASYPLAFKAFAAAQVERKAKKEVQTLVWLDPGVIVLNPPVDLDLGDRFDAVIRPVTLANTIGLVPGTAPNDYWEPIYRKTGLDYTKLPTMKTIADQVDIQPYYNCEVFAFNPRIGLAQHWAGLLKTLLADEGYQKSVCMTFLRKLFLHQAVLSIVISDRIKPERIKPLPLSSSYPFTQHDRLSDTQKATRLSDLSVVIFDYAWNKMPDWMSKIPIEDPLRSRLFDLYQNYLEIAPQIFRIEGSCNSYLVITGDGAVLIDPAGAAVAPEFFEKLIEKKPLKAILLTHAHPDHSDDIARWRKGKDIPVVAQREFTRYFEYVAELDGFFARRNAIWAGKRPGGAAATSRPPQERPNTFFIDHYDLKIGGLSFQITHTPGETPDQSTIFIPELKAVLVGDNYYEYFINNSTFRGTMIRPLLGYIQALDTALNHHPRFFLPGHGSPLVTERAVVQNAAMLRDALRYVYDETIKGINAGKDVHTLMREIRLPERFPIGQYYGKVEWTVRGIWQEYVGWFDENPATMYAEPMSSIYSDLTELAGPERILAKAKQYLDEKQYVGVLHLTELVLKDNRSRQNACTIRLTALKALKAATRNFIEQLWLNHAIRECEAILSEISPKQTK